VAVLDAVTQKYEAGTRVAITGMNVDSAPPVRGTGRAARRRRLTRRTALTGARGA
jgi:hypothetical protein